ncbi:MAG TPA: hypothetical protein VHM20_00820 [Gammaproteobacteria bacterium]|jgi:serine/threonine protein kinase|nr:hypothetical protein [Gammaproteobacteria bacterium]
MEIISKNTFNSLIHAMDTKLLKTTYQRPKLLENSNGKMIKVFYPKNKKFSSNRRKPYALRFCQNADLLRQKGIQTPTIESLQYCQDYNTYILSYAKIPGENARVLAGQNSQTMIPLVAQYIASLHQKGIFFRSLHLENLLFDNNKGFSLIDIVDVKLNRGPLNIFLRYRNLKHMLTISDDRQFWIDYGIHHFMKFYFDATCLSLVTKKSLSLLLKL